MSIECERRDAELRDDALNVVEAVWHGINWESVASRRRMKIYDEYAAKIRSSAHTGRFTHFFGNLCRKMESSPTGKWAEQARIAIERIEKYQLDLDVLELIIAENQYLVLLLRERNETRKAEREEAEARKQMTLGGD
jgi:GH43 family beta-xylosidase